MNKYSILKRIGVGTYGSAYLAENKATRMQCVLKKIKVDDEEGEMRAGGGQQGGQRVQAIQEVQVLSMLDHPLILTYLDHFVYKGHLCIVTDYCEHGDLWQLLCGRTTPLAEVDILDLLAQMLLAIQYVHSRGILHRDLKSQNIFLTKEGTIKLGDFGISRSLNSSIDLAQTIIGTPFYMSPEIMGSQPYDFSSDMWSLGCILYEMMSLKHAFDAADLTSLVLKVMRGEHLPIPENYSSDLKQLAKQLLSKSPKMRPSPEQCIKLPLMKEAVSRARARVDKASSSSSSRQQSNPGSQSNKGSKLGNAISRHTAKFHSRGPSERTSLSGTPEAFNASPLMGRSPGDLDRELALAKERLRLIQEEREALRGGGVNLNQASPPLPPPGGPTMFGRRKSIGNPDDSPQPSIHPSYSEPAPYSGLSDSSNPKARMEARKQEEAKRRETELLEARKQYFEERRLAETKGKSLIYGTSFIGSTKGVERGSSSSRLREDSQSGLSLAMDNMTIGVKGEEEEEMEATRDFEREITQITRQHASVQNYYSVGGIHAVQRGADKAEALRSYCKDALGPQVYDLIYSALRRRVSGVRGATDEARFRQELQSRLGASRMQYVHLVDQIIFFEDQASH